MGEYPKNLESLTVDVDGHVAQVTLVGPGKGNAMGPAFWAELPVVFESLDADADVRAIVLTGSGKHFSYGLDLPAMGDTLSPMMAEGALARPRAEFHTRLRGMQQSITAVADCRTPVIASIHGWCIGGGVDLISAVDIRYASADAKFSVREVKLAIVADVGSLARLPLILSEGHLRELALTGRDIDAERAAQIGLVNDVYDDAEASLAAAHATAKEIAANPPLVVQGVKDVLDEQRTAQVSASLRYVAAWNSAFLASKDLTEGITAMFARRAPEFKGE
jgi:enoyl-CoA hydratase